VGAFLTVLIVGVALLLWRHRANERAAERARARMIAPQDLHGAYAVTPTFASLEHLEPPKEEAASVGSPYRLDDDASNGANDERRERARMALTTARWLLMSAAQDSRAARDERLIGRTEEVDARTLAQNRAESEALQCIFEAEECLGTRIVRGPVEPRSFAPYYGRAAEILAVVDAFVARAFPERRPHGAAARDTERPR
jgi:hypothetical protein